MNEEPFLSLRREYLESAIERVQGLYPLITARRADPDTLDRLRRLAHDLRGSGGFYGFLSISAAAAALEEQVCAVQSRCEAAEGLVAAEWAPLGLSLQGLLRIILENRAMEGE